MSLTIATPLHPIRRLAIRPLVWVLNCGALIRQRRSLAEMDQTRLNDIGLTPEQARIESLRPFWDAPDHWLR